MQTLQTIYADRRLRIVEAAQRAGLNPHQVARRLKRPIEYVRAAFEEADDTLEAWEVCQLAELFHVDARWLATGASSPAAIAAIQEVEYLHQRRLGGVSAMSQAVLKELVRLLATTPQPGIETGVNRCRYCGCTYECACPEGCEWVNRESDICSACLAPLEPE